MSIQPGGAKDGRQPEALANRGDVLIEAANAAGAPP